MNEPNPHNDELDVPDELPPAILEALLEFDGPTPMPDAGRREAVLSGAREHFAEIRRQRRLKMFFAAGAAGASLAAAAAIAIVVYVGNPMGGADSASPGVAAQQPSNEPSYAVAQDHNNDGVFDIGDGLTLARIQANAATGREAYDNAVRAGLDPRQFDRNSDNQLTQIDIDQTNYQAVDVGLARGIEVSDADTTPHRFFTRVIAASANPGTQDGGVR